ncbi:MAG: NAD(P)/FAD-dependent oxidoreductase [Planctomycetes bacterium]|nr:NAD(P)/FAD-dependent oxidoreductase [Planctomycetota bacterium]
MSALPHVVILGGGFGGLQVALELARAPLRVTLVDQNNHHLFQPLLYQVATAGLAVTDIAVPLRQVVRGQANTTVLLAKAQRIEPERRVVVLADGELAYDRLVVATGAESSWFGHDEWALHALPLKDSRDALAIRSRILLAFEAAERCEDPSARERLLTFVVIGGGPTGVELAGALAEIARHTLARNFRRFEPGSARILLVEAGARVLPTFPEELARRAQAALAGMGVVVRTAHPVTNIDFDGVELGPERIRSATVLWAAGVHTTPITRTLGAPLDRAGRVHVAPDLSLPGRPEITVIGDAAAVPWRSGTVPGMSPGAMQMGRHVARNLVRELRGEPPLAFVYRDKGSLATIGRSKAVAVLGRLRFSGFPAWMLWVLVHVFYLIGFRNRFVVLTGWAWLYWTKQRGARVILERPD